MKKYAQHSLYWSSFQYIQVLQTGELNLCLMYMYAFSPYFFKYQWRILAGEVKLGKKIKYEKNTYHYSRVIPQYWFWEEPTSVQEWNFSRPGGICGWKKLMHKYKNVWGCCKNLWLFIMIKSFWSMQRKLQGLPPVAEHCFPGSVLLVLFIHCHFRIT